LRQENPHITDWLNLIQQATREHSLERIHQPCHVVIVKQQVHQPYP